MAVTTPSPVAAVFCRIRALHEMVAIALALCCNSGCDTDSIESLAQTVAVCAGEGHLLLAHRTAALFWPSWAGNASVGW